MAQPAYIMMAESGAIDARSNRVSLFEVVEVVEVTPRQAADPPPEQSRARADRVLVVWMKDEADTPDVAYETQLACVAPDGTDFFVAYTTPFRFPAGAQFFRAITTDLKIPGFPTVGVYRLEGRLRREGDTGWAARQSFPFLVQIKASPPPEAANPH